MIVTYPLSLQLERQSFPKEKKPTALPFKGRMEPITSQSKLLYLTVASSYITQSIVLQSLYEC